MSKLKAYANKKSDKVISEESFTVTVVSAKEGVLKDNNIPVVHITIDDEGELLKFTFKKESCKSILIGEQHIITITKLDGYDKPSKSITRVGSVNIIW
jgi:hypothetical protein